MISIKEFGAVGDGAHDDSAAFNAAFAGGNAVSIPAGEYRIGHTVYIGSDTTIAADPNAHIKMGAGAQKGRDDYFMTTRPGTVTRNVSITGGIWDGNCAQNDRGSDLYDVTATTGVLFNFRGAENLSFTHMTVKDPLCYYWRFCQAKDVVMSDIRFATEHLGPNQDGVHLAGYCYNFLMEDFFGTYGSPNDDFIALNADDALNRQESFDVINGPIENVTVRNLHSDFCHCFVRLLSVTSPITNVNISHVTGACKYCVLNMDMARGCRVPLFHEEDFPNGVGDIRDVALSDVHVSWAAPDRPVLERICIMGNVRSFSVRDFSNAEGTDGYLYLDKLAAHDFELHGMKNAVVREAKAPCVSVTGDDIKGVVTYGDSLLVSLTRFDSLTLNRK